MPVFNKADPDVAKKMREMIGDIDIVDELVKLARLARDAELGADARPPLRLSDVKRRQRRARPFVLLILVAWAASIFAVILLVRPLMVARSDWYGLLIVLYMIP